MFRLSLPRIAVFAWLCCWPLTMWAADPVSPRNANGSITTAIPQPDGKVIVAGSFSYIGPVERAGIARLNADGTLDPTFDPGVGANGPINLLALQTDGKLYIAGAFTTVAGTSRVGIARLNSDGKLDLGFDPGTSVQGDPLAIGDLLVDSNNKAVLAGAFRSFNGVPRQFLVRLNVDGSVDPTFNAGKNLVPLGNGFGYVNHVAFYPDGQLVVLGVFYTGTYYDLARVAVDGTVDQSFLIGGVSNAGIAAQPDGRILIADGCVHGDCSGGLKRVNADGQTDITFNAMANRPTVVRVQPDGRILFIDGIKLARVEYTGTDDPTFTVPQIGSGRSDSPTLKGVEVQADGRILIYGSFNSVNGAPRIGVAQLLPDGTVDSTFVPDQSIIATGFAVNLSTRVLVGADDHVMIGGFIVDGSSSKKLMIRAIGPSLSASGPAIPRPLANPRLSLHDSSGSEIARNDDWRTTETGGVITSDQANEIQASGIAPKDDAESAMIVTLAPGGYTAIVDSSTDGGTALVEMYDLDGSTSTRVANISTRGYVGAGDDVMIAGSILGGTHPTEVLVRALGPSLASSGVAGTLQDPSLTLHNANGFLVGSNEDWHTQESDIRSTEAEPSDPREAAILSVLQPGNYTAVVRGKDNTTGIALVEFYAL